jgi:hypothetical protein
VNKLKHPQIMALASGLGGGALLSLSAFAAPVMWPGNGHEYEFASDPGISWADAYAAVPAGWYLATLTTAAENQWVYDNVVYPALGNVVEPGDEAWLGASAPANRTDPAAGWTWVTGEAWTYAVWASGEPNNSDGVETGLAINRYGNSQWNDEGCCLVWIGGYVIETNSVPEAPPAIATPPSTQTAEVGSLAGFWVEVTNIPPAATYQWYFNGTNVVGGTNSYLVLTNVQPAQAGAYTVVVTNFGGAVTSAPALLSVIPPVVSRIVPALNLTGDVGSFLRLDYVNGFGPAAQWLSLSNLTLLSTPQLYFDLSEPPPVQRFYRTSQTNVPSARPVLDMRLATEIPLTGAIGSSVQIDYINRFGPTNAWVTLDTVTLTNSPQLYFDVTMFRQPTRLYGLVAVP